MKNKKKKGQVTVILGAAMLCAMTGCGKAGGNAEGQAEDIIRIENEAGGEENSGSGQSQPEQGENHEESTGLGNGQENGTGENARPENEQKADSVWVEEPASDGGTGMKEIESETELNGTVQSIGEGSIVVSRIHTYVEENGSSAAVEMAEASGGDELITVYFSENTQFIVRTVKNGGVNGDSDAENRDGTASDIEENKTVLLTGGYEGENFRAEQVIIYHFV